MVEVDDDAALTLATAVKAPAYLSLLARNHLLLRVVHPVVVELDHALQQLVPHVLFASSANLPAVEKTISQLAAEDFLQLMSAM